MKHLTPRQRHLAYLELLCVRDECKSKFGAYNAASRHALSAARQAAFAGFADDANDLCKVSDYFLARGNTT